MNRRNYLVLALLAPVCLIVACNPDSSKAGTSARPGWRELLKETSPNGDEWDSLKKYAASARVLDDSAGFLPYQIDLKLDRKEPGLNKYTIRVRYAFSWTGKPVNCGLVKAHLKGNSKTFPVNPVARGKPVTAGGSGFSTGLYSVVFPCDQQTFGELVSAAEANALMISLADGSGSKVTGIDADWHKLLPEFEKITTKAPARINELALPFPLWRWSASVKPTSD